MLNDKRIEKITEDESLFFEFLHIPFPYNRPASNWYQNIESKRVIIADPHEPYSDERVYQHVLTNHKDSRRILIQGDLGDFYSKSPYRKNKSVDFATEIREIFYRLEWLATNFEVVEIMTGNHDNRPEKRIQDCFRNGEVSLVILTEQNLIKRLASYFDNVIVCETKLFSPDNNPNISLTYVYQSGDAIFLHLERSRKHSSSLLEFISHEYLYDWRHELELKPYRAIFQAHNHRATLDIVGGELRMLVPCAMTVRSIGGSYIYHPNVKGKPPVLGYAIHYQENGITDFNRTNFYLIE